MPNKRLNIGTPDELYKWLVQAAKENGIAVSTYATLLLSQAKRNSENANAMQEYMRQFSNLPPEVLMAEFAKSIGKDLGKKK